MIDTTYNDKDCLSVARAKTFTSAVLEYCEKNNIEVTRENIIDLRNNSIDKLIAFWEDKFVTINNIGEKVIQIEISDKIENWTEIIEYVELPYPEAPTFSDKEWKEGRIPCDIDFTPIKTIARQGIVAIILDIDKTNV